MKDRLYIDINNNPHILQLIIDTLPYLYNSWSCYTKPPGENEAWNKYPNQTAKYYGFDLKYRRFSWAINDEDGLNCVESFNPVRNISDASKLMDYVYQMDSTGDIEDSPDGRWKMSKKIVY